MAASPPIFVILAAQAASVLGDIFGQRAARKDMKRSSRHMLIGLTLVSGLQILCVLGILQYSLPLSISGALYDSDHGTTPLKCYSEVDIHGQDPSFCEQHACLEISCPTQGPFSMMRSIILHPLLLLNGVQNIVYYFGEVILYHQPLGCVLIVLASLAASFVIVPLENLFGISDHPVPISVLLLGLVGSLLCVLERPATAEDGTISEMYQAQWKQLTNLCGCGPSGSETDRHLIAATPSYITAQDDTDIETRDYQNINEEEGIPTAPVSYTMSLISVGGPFLMLSCVYSLWFVSQKIFNNKYRTNAFGYTSIDQILAPAYMLVFMLMVDFIPLCKNMVLAHGEQNESLGQALIVTWKKLTSNGGRGLLTLFVYRTLINARAIVYFFLGVMYNLQQVYLELTLIRIVMSWLLAMAVCAWFPAFIDMSPSEQKTVFAPQNMLLKVLGTALIIGALVLTCNTGNYKEWGPGMNHCARLEKDPKRVLEKDPMRYLQPVFSLGKGPNGDCGCCGKDPLTKKKMAASPPIFVILAAQAASVLGDLFGQRAARKDMKRSSRHMLIGLTLVSGLQILCVLGILQYSLPLSISGALYDSDHGTTPLKCYSEVDLNGLDPSFCELHSCLEISCPTQGPFSMMRSIILHPLLLLNGVQNVVYYFGIRVLFWNISASLCLIFSLPLSEVILYHQPLGCVLIVLASLAASFVIVPLENLFGISDHPVPISVLLLGLAGSLLCVLERPATAEDGTISEMYQAQWKRLTNLCGCGPSVSETDRNSFDHFQPPAVTPSSLTAHDDIYSETHDYHNIEDTEGTLTAPVSYTISLISVGGPFLMLSCVYSLWFVSQKIFNNKYRTNAFGYTSIDQILAPGYMLIFMLLVDFIPLCKQLVLAHGEQNESLGQAIRITWQKLTSNGGRGLLTLFVYRTLINARAIVYFFLGVMYNLQQVYLELTLIRIVMSWLLAMAVCAWFPAFIAMSPSEQKTVFAPQNMLLKLLGTALIIGALVQMS